VREREREIDKKTRKRGEGGDRVLGKVFLAKPISGKR
jgi:hypothetical protein